MTYTNAAREGRTQPGKIEIREASDPRWQKPRPKSNRRDRRRIYTLGKYRYPGHSPRPYPATDHPLHHVQIVARKLAEIEKLGP